jgi:hypothetical protein
MDRREFLRMVGSGMLAAPLVEKALVAGWASAESDDLYP